MSSEPWLTSLTAARRVSHLRSLATSRRSGAQPLPGPPPPVRPPAAPRAAPVRPPTTRPPPNGPPPAASRSAAPAGGRSRLKDTHSGACHATGTGMASLVSNLCVFACYFPPTTAPMGSHRLFMDATACPAAASSSNGSTPGKAPGILCRSLQCFTDNSVAKALSQRGQAAHLRRVDLCALPSVLQVPGRLPLIQAACQRGHKEVYAQAGNTLGAFHCPLRLRRAPHGWRRPLAGQLHSTCTPALSVAIPTPALRQLAAVQCRLISNGARESSKWAHSRTQPQRRRAAQPAAKAMLSTQQSLPKLPCIAHGAVKQVTCRAAQVKQHHWQDDQRTQRVSRSLPESRLDLGANRAPWRHMSCAQSTAPRGAR